MSFPGPLGDNPDDPFAAMAGMLSQFLSTFGGGSGGGWEQAKQMAAAIANEGHSHSNVDPVDRIAVEELGRVAELHVSDLMGHPVSGRVTLVSRSQWTAATLDQYRALFERLAGSIGAAMRLQLDDADPDELAQITELTGQSFGPDPQAFLAGLSQMMGPMMLSMMAGSTIGQLGTRAFGSYQLPIPRSGTDEVMIVGDTVSTFGTDWDIPRDDLRLWVCIEQLAQHEILRQPAMHARLLELLGAHADGFTADLSGLEEQMRDLDPMSPEGVEALGDLLGDPEVVLGAMRSPAQEALLPSIDAIVCIAGGYVDWVVDSVTKKLLPDHERISEALRRRRVETDQASRFVERLFGLELTQAKFDLGDAFVATVIERAGSNAVGQLWSHPEMLPTAAEFSSPGLWLARVGLDQDAELPELDSDVEIPDFPDLGS